MSGLYGVASKDDCVADLFYGTDYHSHLGTVRGGMVVKNGQGLVRSIKDITNAQFRSKLEDDLSSMHGSIGIGVISDYEDQPLIIGSHLGTYALVTVGRIENELDLIAGCPFESKEIDVRTGIEAPSQSFIRRMRLTSWLPAQEARAGA